MLADSNRKITKQNRRDWQYLSGEYGDRSSGRKVDLTERVTCKKRLEHERVNHVVSGGSVHPREEAGARLAGSKTSWMSRVAKAAEMHGGAAGGDVRSYRLS